MARKKALLEKDTVHGFITFIEYAQSKMPKRVISLEARDRAQHFKELKERQIENKPFDPEEEFKKLKD